MDTATGLALQPDGKIVVAGNGGGNIIVARFNPDGTLDTTFGNAGGEEVVNYGGNEHVADVALSPTGQIYLGGTHNVYQSNATEFYAIRLNADGSLDRSFGYNGLSHGDANRGAQGGGVGAQAIAIDPSDGSVIVVGNTQNSQYVGPSIAGTRLLPNGNAADSFAYAQSPNGALAEDVLVQSDRTIVVVGESNNAAYAQRLNPDGTIDPTWVGPGTIMAPPTGTSQLNGVAQLADGSYVVVGQELPASANSNYGLIAHLNTDGTVVNNTDGTPGVVTYQVPNANTVGPYNTAYADVAVAPDGSLYAAGETHGWLLISKYRLA
jgi:uncharacterized delta-60 repeat protein